jgi:glutathione S-transferase
MAHEACHERNTVRLYDYAASGNCYKARCLLSLLEKEYERVPVDIFAGETLTPDYAALNPARETPVLELDDGTTLTQSNAILWFLAEGGPVLPNESVARAHVLSWLMFEQEYVISGIAAPRFHLMTGRGTERSIAFAQRRGRQALDRLEDHLREREFLVGRFSIADISVYAYTHVASDAGLELDTHPAVAAWLERVETQQRFVNDLVPYPENARAGMSRSIYD